MYTLKMIGSWYIFLNCSLNEARKKFCIFSVTHPEHKALYISKLSHSMVCIQVCKECICCIKAIPPQFIIMFYIACIYLLLWVNFKSICHRNSFSYCVSSLTLQHCFCMAFIWPGVGHNSKYIAWRTPAWHTCEWEKFTRGREQLWPLNVFDFSQETFWV